MLKLFQVTCYHNSKLQTDTFENFVIASDENEACKIVNEGVWSLSGMSIKCVKEISMNEPILLCSLNTSDLE